MEPHFLHGAHGRDGALAVLHDGAFGQFDLEECGGQSSLVQGGSDFVD
jgi:hypothetical protein